MSRTSSTTSQLYGITTALVASCNKRRENAHGLYSLNTMAKTTYTRPSRGQAKPEMGTSHGVSTSTWLPARSCWKSVVTRYIGSAMNCLHQTTPPPRTATSREGTKSRVNFSVNNIRVRDFACKQYTYVLGVDQDTVLQPPHEILRDPP